jgi:hypothetical protein
MLKKGIKRFKWEKFVVFEMQRVKKIIGPLKSVSWLSFHLGGRTVS